MYRTLQKPAPTGNIVLTARDKLLLRAALRFRFITTDQAQALSGTTSRTKLNHRLAQLWAHDYLDRPAVQLQAFGYADKRHTVHALGQRGAEWLAVNDGVKFPKGKGWQTANQLRSAERLAHQIGVVDTVLRFERAIGAVAGLELRHQDELFALAAWPAKLKPHRLPTRVEQGGAVVERGTDPDYTLAISKIVDGKARASLCFLEWDNSSEDFIKANQLASSIAQKHRCYADAYRRKLHTELYGFNNFRTLFVVNGDAARVNKMAAVGARVVGEEAPAGIFWYTTMAELEARGPLSDIWLSGDGQRRALV